jgi:hypothetical protein
MVVAIQLLKLHRIINIKYLLLLLTSLSLQASLDKLDLTLPEQPAVYIPPEKEFIFNFGDYKEPPTKNQMITFWTLNALDVYITYNGVKKPNVYELNPILSKKPKLEELLLQKAIVSGFMSKHSSKKYIRFLNVTLTFVVINNYEIMK